MPAVERVSAVLHCVHFLGQQENPKIPVMCIRNPALQILQGRHSFGILKCFHREKPIIAEVLLLGPAP
jgi:hypothetical protein